MTGPGYPLLPDRRLGPRLPQPADPRAAAARLRDGGKLSSADMAAIAAGHAQPDGARAGAVPARRPHDARRTTPAGQRLLRDWDFTQPAGLAPRRRTSTWSGATCSRLTFHDELPGGAVARRRRTLDRGGAPGCCASPTSQWWDDVDHRRASSRTRDDILRAAMREARDELTRSSRAQPDGWTWGAAAPARPAEPDARRVGHRAGRAAASTGAATRSAAATRSSTRPRWDAVERRLRT